MSKYKYVITFCDGSILDSMDNDELFDSYSFAEEAALYAISCSNLGAEILHMSNPGDYSYDEAQFEDAEYDIIELDDEE